MKILFFSFHIKIKRPRVAERGKPALFLGGGRGGVVLCHILIEIVSTWTIVGNVFGCVILSGG